MSDVTNNLFGAGQKLEIYHAPSRKSVQFKAFIKTFEDDYGASWEKDAVFGRNDPHRIFKHVERVINLEWAVPAYSESEAIENMKKMSSLINMQYPVYDGDAGTNSRNIASATTISASPIFRVKFMNLIQDASSSNFSTSKARAKDNGLLGVMVDGISFSPNFEHGTFMNNVQGKIYPKVFDLSFTYGVLHTHRLGWFGDKIRQEGFPYGEDLSAGSTSRDSIKAAESETSSGDANLQEGNEPPKTATKNKTKKAQDAQRRKASGVGPGSMAKPVNLSH